MDLRVIAMKASMKKEKEKEGVKLRLLLNLVVG
jgi:hypothetical protein